MGPDSCIQDCTVQETVKQTTVQFEDFLTPFYLKVQADNDVQCKFN